MSDAQEKNKYGPSIPFLLLQMSKYEIAAEYFDISAMVAEHNEVYQLNDSEFEILEDLMTKRQELSKRHFSLEKNKKLANKFNAQFCKNKENPYDTFNGVKLLLFIP